MLIKMFQIFSQVFVTETQKQFVSTETWRRNGRNKEQLGEAAVRWEKKTKTFLVLLIGPKWRNHFCGVCNQKSKPSTRKRCISYERSWTTLGKIRLAREKIIATATSTPWWKTTTERSMKPTSWSTRCSRTWTWTCPSRYSKDVP